MKHAFSPAPLLMAIAAAITAALTCGCGGRPGPDYSVLKLAHVEGVVTLDGEPLSGARVEFVEADKLPPRICFGTTDSSGLYQLFRDRNVAGCLPGEMVVKITTGEREEGEDEPTADATIAARYNRRSELSRTVEPHGSHEFNFELTSD
ncbi:hypothetical protein Mal64_39390 [Pseudobythopirellula maris]|uniref:Carboxypeptidase regulatory-like domain-containing protein n=1 Tax=Pseudobythopirellula maris TaxID=2527991 RepID=A0A5C5ZG49_9BACT|nr:hypothetical protein [Pseudobythopirellula maris]TWT86196.1 hypothetical protein Mal64_39390 [Pseudobythopirellula maris]